MGIEDDDMDILRKRIMRQETQYTRLLLEQSKYNPEDDTDPAEDKLPLPESVFIILFQPETPEQHVHTIEFPKGSGNNILLAFEDENECNAFADMLVRDMGFKDPCPEETEFAPLAQYCNSIGMAVAMVPEGFDLTPPQINSDDEDEDEYVGFKPIVEDKSEKNASNNSMNSSVDDGDAWQ
ncbi:hypothetical protein ACHAWO_001187 [Cyclotella atomus]|uniref:Uncharacterized protein n=1 Tax=Cyclotella atomus TaxID=382360 RepID=A0ABD3NFY0_9STRA